jgi:hypothetical protein
VVGGSSVEWESNPGTDNRLPQKLEKVGVWKYSTAVIAAAVKGQQGGIDLPFSKIPPADASLAWSSRSETRGAREQGP